MKTPNFEQSSRYVYQMLAPWADMLITDLVVETNSDMETLVDLTCIYLRVR